MTDSAKYGALKRLLAPARLGLPDPPSPLADGMTTGCNRAWKIIHARDLYHLWRLLSPNQTPGRPAEDWSRSPPGRASAVVWREAVPPNPIRWLCPPRRGVWANDSQEKERLPRDVLISHPVDRRSSNEHEHLFIFGHRQGEPNSLRRKQFRPQLAASLVSGAGLPKRPGPK